MTVNMPVNVISKACAMCPRLKIMIENEYSGSEIVERTLECSSFDDCLQAIEIWQKGQEDGNEQL